MRSFTTNEKGNNSIETLLEEHDLKIIIIFIFISKTQKTLESKKNFEKEKKFVESIRVILRLLLSSIMILYEL